MKIKSKASETEDGKEKKVVETSLFTPSFSSLALVLLNPNHFEGNPV